MILDYLILSCLFATIYMLLFMYTYLCSGTTTTASVLENTIQSILMPSRSELEYSPSFIADVSLGILPNQKNFKTMMWHSVLLFCIIWACVPFFWTVLIQCLLVSILFWGSHTLGAVCSSIFDLFLFWNVMWWPNTSKLQ